MLVNSEKWSAQKRKVLTTWGGLLLSNCRVGDDTPTTTTIRRKLICLPGFGPMAIITA